MSFCNTIYIKGIYQNYKDTVNNIIYVKMGVTPMASLPHWNYHEKSTMCSVQNEQLTPIAGIYASIPYLALNTFGCPVNKSLDSIEPSRETPVI